MCKSKAAGGQRCASHALKNLKSARLALSDDPNSVGYERDYQKVVDASVAYASTSQGAELFIKQFHEAVENGAEDGTVERLRNIVDSGAAMAQVNRTLENHYRERNGKRPLTTPIPQTLEEQGLPVRTNNTDSSNDIDTQINAVSETLREAQREAQVWMSKCKELNDAKDELLNKKFAADGEPDVKELVLNGDHNAGAHKKLQEIAQSYGLYQHSYFGGYQEDTGAWGKIGPMFVQHADTKAADIADGIDKFTKRFGDLALLDGETTISFLESTLSQSGSYSMRYNPTTGTSALVSVSYGHVDRKDFKTLLEGVEYVFKNHPYETYQDTDDDDGGPLYDNYYDNPYNDRY